MPTTLSGGQSLGFNFSYTAPANGSVPVDTTIQSSNGGSNNAHGETLIIVADVTTTINVPPTAMVGATVNGTLEFGNDAAASANANNVTYATVIGTPSSCPAGVTFTTLPASVSYSYYNSSCQVTFAGSGLPASLTPGQMLNFAFSYTGPAAAATVPVSSAITTATPETITSNNTSTDQTVFSADPPRITLDKTGPATVTTGGNLAYVIGLGNSGGTASGTTLTVSDTLPTGVTFVSAVAGTNVTSVSCTGAPTLSCTVNLTAALAAGAANGAASFTINTTAPSTSGSITNYASVDPDGGATPPTPGSACTPATSCDDAGTTINAPKLTITKTASPTGLTIGTPLPTDCTNPSGQDIVCTIAAGLTAGTGTISFTIPVPPTSTATTGDNTAYVTGGGDPTCENDTDCPGTLTVPIYTATNITLNKTGPADVLVNDIIVYTISLGNSG